MNYKKFFFVALIGVMTPIIADDNTEPEKKLSQREKIKEELKKQKIENEKWEAECTEKMKKDGITTTSLISKRLHEEPLIIALVEDTFANDPKKSNVDEVINNGKAQWNEDRNLNHIKIAGPNHKNVYYYLNHDSECVLADERRAIDKQYDEKIAKMVALGQAYKSEFAPVLRQIYLEKEKFLNQVLKSHETDIASIKDAITDNLRQKRCVACLEYESAAEEYDAMVEQSLNDFIKKTREDVKLPLFYEEGQKLLSPFWKKINPLIEEKYNLCKAKNEQLD